MQPLPASPAGFYHLRERRPEYTHGPTSSISALRRCRGNLRGPFMSSLVLMRCFGYCLGNKVIKKRCGNPTHTGGQRRGTNALPENLFFSSFPVRNGQKKTCQRSITAGRKIVMTYNEFFYCSPDSGGYLSCPHHVSLTE